MCLEALNRRKFLKLLGSGAIAATIDAYSKPFEQTVAYADFNSNSTKKVITIFQAGGPSNSSVPVFESGYYDIYPTLHFKPEDAIPLNNTGRPIGLHPDLKYFGELAKEGSLSVVQGAGMSNYSRSHDMATRFCDLGSTSRQYTSTGFGARLVADSGPFGGFAFRDSEWGKGGQNVRTGSNFGATFRESNFSSNQVQEQFVSLRDSLLRGEEKKFAKGNASAQYVLDNLHRGIDSAKYILSTLEGDLPDIDVSFPNTSLGRQTEEAARLINSALGVKALRLQQGGYDTHGDEGTRLPNLLTNLNASVEALVKTLKALGTFQDTVIYIFGEFGRTKQNRQDSRGGSDHGHAQNMFVISGAGLRTNVIGEPLYQDIRRTYIEGKNVDFRQVILEGCQKLGFQTDSLFPDLRSSSIGLFT